MIELTEQQASIDTEAHPPRILNPKTRQTFVLLPVEYERMTRDEYDDSPWADEERAALSNEARCWTRSGKRHELQTQLCPHRNGDLRSGDRAASNGRQLQSRSCQ